MIPLFERFPTLKEKLPYVPLGDYPTPIAKLNKMGKVLRLNHLYIKRDDVTSKTYGGNKIRKLEFILGDVLRRDSKEVITFGFAGSNHALATAICAKQLGVKSISMLLPQPHAYYVRHNLLMGTYYDVEFHQHPSKSLLYIGALYQLLRHWLRNGKLPYIIPPGGSSPLGTIGFVNAAFELGNQIAQNEMPEPERIYVALGTAGTAVGLIIGLKASKIASKVIPVRVAEHSLTDEKSVHKLYSETITLLNSMDPSFPKLESSADEIEIVDEYLGNGYAQFTKEAREAIRLMDQAEGIKLDGTYTGKACAALIADAQKQDLKNKVILFWNTLNSKDFTDFIKNIDYHQLPKSFHKYFEEEVQL